MSKQVTIAVEEDVEDEISVNIVLRGTDVDDIADKITNDIRTVNIDTCHKVNYLKSRIVQILTFYKRKSVDEVSSTISDSQIEEMRNRAMIEIRKSVGSLCQKAKLDTNVIHLYDKALAEEAKHQIHRKVLDENFSRLKDKTKEELQNINDRTKILTSATKSAIEDFLLDPQTEKSNGVKIGTKDCFKTTDAETKKLVALTKNNIRENVGIFLTNPTGKKTVEEIESEKMLKGNLLQIENKIKEDIRNRKEVVDRTIEDINSKVRNLLPLRWNDDEN